MLVNLQNWSHKMAENRKPCSCHMCGNPRKHWKELTIQEKRKNSDDYNDDY